MPSSLSSFKERLRLPRLFFRRPSREEQIHGGPPLEFERPIPPLPWRGITVVVVLIVIGVVTAWELYARAKGYRPTLNDNEDLWTWRGEEFSSNQLSLLGIRGRGSTSILMNSKRAWGSALCNSRWLVPPFFQCWPTWRTTKIFTARLFAALSRTYFLRRQIPLRWSAPKRV